MAENRLLYRIIEQEGALRRAEELKYRVFDWIDAGLLVLNHDGRITTVNQRTLDWLPGHDRNEMIGSGFDAYFPEFLPFWKERELACLRRNMVVSTQRGLVFGFKMTELPENQGWMILFSDITEVQRLERQVKEMEKLASVGELAAGLAHEMKNPLAGIKTSLQLLLSDDLEKEYSERLSRVILRDIDRLDFLLKDFLIFARPKAPQPQALDLVKELDHVLMPLRLQYPEVMIHIEVGPEPFYFDRNQLHQVLINLVVNAMQALENTQNPKISITDTIERNTRTLVISDNGPGLASEMEGKCFDPFVTSKAVGSGLGLAIARRLAVQNGTFIDLSSIPTGGTTAVMVQNLSFFRTEKDSQDTP
ncbi:MAG: PAS domain-containing protein [Desulfomicrobium sp.]|nr:PAS domain-containing protein [Pseudomonadota bacterium]MBV1712851.1 PAS domain-containing protein [Desulfomicrobium sp.]MBU4571821.1 PAS domain-containing protein [Pseudomonadota bacterium]MBU4595970.1 PAS domain-containing protein [Pseudomonadota bacterium]MBV1721274.1 PAS domain-containing protein [Desulfomicrobium sp.]